MIFPDDLIVGDTLGYASADLTNLAIEWKEGDDLAHVEVYAGNGQSWASRNGIGVNIYPFRLAGLKIVRRNKGIFEEEPVEVWFKSGVQGMKYGFGDILAEVEIGASGYSGTDLTKCDGVDCSHLYAALQEVARCPHFDPTYPKNHIEPRDMKLSLASVQVYP